jgi:hypothetical protein
MDDFIRHVELAGAEYRHLDRHPDLLRMAVKNELQRPYYYIFEGSTWPRTIRRKSLVHISSQQIQTAQASTLSLYHLEGSSVFIEKFTESLTHYCRAFQSCAESTLALATISRPMERTTQQSNGSSPFDRSSSASSSASSTLSSFDLSYIPLTLCDLSEREATYSVDRLSAWNKWPEHLNISRRRSFVDVLDDLVAFFGASAATTHTAAYFLDKFLETANASSYQPSKRNLRVLVCVATLVACKQVDTQWPTLPEITAVIHQWDRERPSMETIASAELLLLQNLEFRLQPPTLRDAVAACLSLDEVPSMDYTVPKAMWIADAVLRDLHLAKWPMQELAVSVIAVAAAWHGPSDLLSLSHTTISQPSIDFVRDAVLRALHEKSTPLMKRLPVF